MSPESPHRPDLSHFISSLERRGGFPFPVLRNTFPGSELERGNIPMEEQWRRTELVVQTRHHSLRERSQSPFVVCFCQQHRGQEGGRLQTPRLLLPLPFLRDSWGGVGSTGRSRWPTAACAPGLAPTVLLPPFPDSTSAPWRAASSACSSF